MTRIPGTMMIVIALAAGAGCVDEPRHGELRAAAGFEPYIPQQGRMLLGFAAGDVRTFVLALPAAQVVDGELRAGGLTGSELAGVALTATRVDGSQLAMRIASVSQLDGGWRYALEQWAAGGWQPACASPPPLLPGSPPPSPLAIALPGRWTAAGGYVRDATAISFACGAGVVAKCTRWGFGADARPPATTPHGWPVTAGAGDLLQTCTRLARADYCASGEPNTIEGTPIQVIDAFGDDELAPGFAFEAAWRGRAEDETGLSPLSPVCLSKLRWATLPLGGDCPGALRDPRIDPKGRFCDDLSRSDLEAAGALIYSASPGLDVGLLSHEDAPQKRVIATTHLVLDALGSAPAWDLDVPADLGFPSPTAVARFEGTLLAPSLPEALVDGLVPLASYACHGGAVWVGSGAPPGAGCAWLAAEGFAHPPHTAGRTPLRRWSHPSRTGWLLTTRGPEALLASGWRLDAVIGGVVRAPAEVALRWPAIAASERFEIAVQARRGEWLPACFTLPAGATMVSYRGACSDGRALATADVTAFRVTASLPSVVLSAEVAHDGAATDAYAALPAGTRTAIAVTWPAGEADEQFDLAIDRGDGFEPCLGREHLANSAGHVFTGACPATGLSVAPERVKRVRVCVRAAGGTPRCASGPVSGPALRLVPGR